MSILVDGQVWRGELTIGTREGYQGPEVVKPGDLIPLIEAFQREGDPWYPAIVWTRGTVIGPMFPAETVIKVTVESNPLYTPNTSEGEFAGYIAALALHLAIELKQVRVYTAIYAIRSMLIENTDMARAIA